MKQGRKALVRNIAAGFALLAGLATGSEAAGISVTLRAAGLPESAALGATMSATTAPQPAAIETGSSPALLRKWEGERGYRATPTDLSSAVGTSRFIEMINSSYAIYDRSSTEPLRRGPLSEIGGCAHCDAEPAHSDPQVLWDAQTKRFYVVYLETSLSGNALLFAFSRHSSPIGPAEWCRYTLDFGNFVPDYPKLGDTQHFLLIGINAVQGGTSGFAGGNVSYVSKPPAGYTCPEATDFFVGNESLTNASSPVPANQIDRSPTGWIVSTTQNLPEDRLLLFKVTRAANGHAAIETTGSDVDVDRFEAPLDAPQKDSSDLIDTLDGRLTQAVSAFDPSRGRVGLWTQHTVLGGAGAQVRWYEIDPAQSDVFQSGRITHHTQWHFNAAISPDRVRRGAVAAYGENMALSFNRSSGKQYVELYVVSKRGDDPVSAPLRVGASTGPERPDACFAGECSWGETSAMSPDPRASTETGRGRVWGSSMLAVPLQTYDNATRRTRNFVVQP